MEIAAAEGGMSNSLQRRLKKLKGSRTGKKRSITMRINQLDRMVSEKGGRRAIQLLVEHLKTVYNELEAVCDEISTISDEEDPYNDIEEIRFQVETSVATVTEYLEARMNDPASESSSVALSWVKKHLHQFGQRSGAPSSRSGEGSVEENLEEKVIPEGAVSTASQVQPLNRYTYSDSRPATPIPRVLPCIPTEQSVTLIDNITKPFEKALVLDVSAQTPGIEPTQEDVQTGAYESLHHNLGMVNQVNPMANPHQCLGRADEKEESTQYEWDPLFANGTNGEGKDPEVDQGLGTLQRKLVRTAVEAMEAGDLPNYREMWDQESVGKENYSFQGGGVTFPLSTSFSGDEDVRKRFLADPGKPTSSGMVMEDFRRNGMDSIKPFTPKTNAVKSMQFVSSSVEVAGSGTPSGEVANISVMNHGHSDEMRDSQATTSNQGMMRTNGTSFGGRNPFASESNQELPQRKECSKYDEQGGAKSAPHSANLAPPPLGNV